MQQTQQQQQLPHRFRESSFRVYEAIVAAIVKAYPQTVSFNPGLYNLSSVTFSCRLRDAIKSYNKHHWETTAFDKAMFDRAYLGGICVSEHHDTATVTVGSKSNIRIKSNKVLDGTLNVGVEQSKSQHPTELGQVSSDDFVMICRLAGHRALSVEVHCELFLENVVKFIDDCTAAYDCSIESLGNNKYSIL